MMNAKFGELAFQRAPGWLAPGRRVYAVGDVHGCADRLLAMHALIRADLAARPVAAPLLVHLGDLIDRGPDSAGVLEILAGKAPCPTVNLRGNHEAALAAALAGDAAAATDWLIGGGRETLASWGADAERRETWEAAIPAGHKRVLRQMDLWAWEGGYFFAHAGVRPGVELRRQAEGDLLTIRQPFLDSAAEHGAVVVHGHTPKFAVELRENRIGIDTAAVFGGKLTCAVLEDERVGFLQV